MSIVLRVFVPLVLAAAVLAACKREAPPAGEDARAPTAQATPAAPSETSATTGTNAVVDTPPPAAGPAGASAGTNRYDEPKFALVAQGNGSYAAGQEGALEIVLDAKPPFHANQQYPYKFKAKEGAGVKFSQPVIGKDAAKVEQQRVTMRVPFVPDGAGQRTVSGQFAFSVCTEETCLMEKRDLSLVVDVK
jgi:hypothetical protein